MLSKQFYPKLKYYETESLIDTGWEEKKIKNTRLYDLIKKLTNLAFPTIKYTEFDKRWFYFYLPLRRRGCLITLPFAIVEYNKEFFVCFHNLGRLHIKKGKEKIEKEYKNCIFTILNGIK